MSLDFEQMRREAHAIADALPEELLHRWVVVGRALRHQTEAKTPEDVRLWQLVAKITWEDHDLFKRLAAVDIGPEHYPDPKVVAEAQARMAAEDAQRLAEAKTRAIARQTDN